MPAKRRRPAAPSLRSLALGDVLRQAREEQELRQEDIARTAGVTEATVQRLERGHWPTDPMTLDVIVAVYGQVARRSSSLPRMWAAVRLANGWADNPLNAPASVKALIIEASV